jgi:transcriptional regulator with XRE-family HTH domain
MNIGGRVRELREDLGMSQAELARRVGAARNTVVMIENGSRVPSMALLEKLARELRTEPAELLKEPIRPLAEALPDMVTRSASGLESVRARARRNDPEGNRLYEALKMAQATALKNLQAAKDKKEPPEDMEDLVWQNRLFGRLWAVVWYERNFEYINASPLRGPEAPQYPDTTALGLDDAWAMVVGKLVPTGAR